MAQPVTAPLVKDKLRPTAKDNLCSWVGLPDGRRYLLPIVSRQQRIAPVIVDGKIVAVEVSTTDEKLSQCVEEYFTLARCLKGSELTLGEESIIKLFDVVRQLLLTNYDFDDAEITKLLTLKNDEMSKLVETIQTHISKR